MADVENGLGRVAILDGSEAARRVVRAVRALAREGLAEAAVLLHAPGLRRSPLLREADEASELGPDAEESLRRARAGGAWLGPASLSERAAFADACARAGVVHVGPSADALRWLAAPGALGALAARLGLLPGEAAGLTRRIEVVVARDRSGGASALGLGDASLRAAGHAALVESPPPGLPPELEERARALGLRAAVEADWVGVCAVELGLEPSGRISLAALGAHPSSGPALEEATGADLLALALRLAAGLPLEAAGVRLSRGGHALAARLVAAGAPSGRVERLRLASCPGVRADVALEEGDDAPAGAVIATVVARAEQRADALARLGQALAESDVLLRGAAPSTAWLRALCSRPEIRAGRLGAGLLDALASAGEPAIPKHPELAVVAAALEAYDAELDLERARFVTEARRGRPRVGPSSGREVELRHAGRRHRLEGRQVGPDAYRIVPAGGAALEVRVERLGAHERRLTWRGGRARLLVASDGPRQTVQVDGVPHVVRRDPAGVVSSPMPAVVMAIPVAPGQRVSAGEPVARVESMKVEMVVPAPHAGVVREVLAVANAQVDAGGPLVRLVPEGETAQEPAAAPLSLGSPPPPEPADPGRRYLAALAELQRLVLGFDVSAAEARRLAAGWRERSEAAPHGDAATLDAESRVVAAFADVQALYSRARPPGEDAGTVSPLEELWRYLHEPEARGAGLGAAFVAGLRRALSHYGLSLEVSGRELEVALLRMQKAYERAGEQLAPLLGVLERWLAAPDAPAALAPRDQLDRLAAIGQERFPALADLAREVRYRRHDQPGVDRVAAEAYAQAEGDLARLRDASGPEREALVARIVECPQSIATLLVSRMAAAPPGLRARLVETLLRRYYRERALGPVELGEVEGLACAWGEYVLEGQRFRVVAGFAHGGEIEQAVRRLARLAAEVPPDRRVAAELYVWHGEAPPGEALAERLRAALEQAGFVRPLRRASFVIARPGRGLGRQASQEHFTFRGGPREWEEDRRHRGVHPMLFKRLQLGRLARFELERLPSVEDVYLYRGVARDAPKDERLFAAAEVRAVVPVRDAEGRVVQMPHVERMLHEALAGMRRFQARRAPGQRLEWNRVLLTVGPPLPLSPQELRGLADRVAPAAAGLGLEMVLIDARVPDPGSGELRPTLLRFVADERGGVSIRWDEPTDRPLEPMAEYEQRVVQLRRRGLTHPFEIVKLLAPPRGAQATVPPGEFVEHDLDPTGALVPVDRPPGRNAANVVVGTVRSFTERHPEGMLRVVLLGDPSRAMGSLAEPECARIEAAVALAERLGVPLEWFAVSAGAKISMESGTENMDWISRVLRRIVEFTQRGGELNVVVVGINVGAQPYWNAEATMLMHTRGILVMTPGSAMVLTGKEALEYSGSVSAEDNQGIGGYDRIMGPNGQAQYRAGSVAEAIELLLRHYAHTYVAPGERHPRRGATADPVERDVRASPHGPEGGAGFGTVGDVFSLERNPDRKKPFDIRRVMAACVDRDHATLERWADLRGGETAVVWDAHLGGWPVCLVGIESRPLPRLEFVPADGPDLWSAGTLFPQSSRKIARALNSATGNRPLVVLANLSGFDGSPESMRRLQLEYGAEIGRAVVNFRGSIVFCVVSRYHGGAFVVFSKALREDMEVVAVEGARASVIGGAPAAAVVFAREVESRVRKDPRHLEAERAAAAGGAARLRLVELANALRAEKVGEVAEAFDAIHTVERALRVGSLDRIIAPQELRPYLVAAVERGYARLAKG